MILEDDSPSEYFPYSRRKAITAAAGSCIRIDAWALDILTDQAGIATAQRLVLRQATWVASIAVVLP